MQPLQPWKRGNECLELLQEHNRRDGQRPQTHRMSLTAASSWAFLGSLKQAVYAGSWKAWNIDQLKKIDHFGGQRHRCWAVTKRISRPNDQGQTCRQQWRFGCFVNSSPFSHGNTVCTYQIFFHLLQTFIEIHPFESCPIFYSTSLRHGLDVGSWSLSGLERLSAVRSMPSGANSYFLLSYFLGWFSRLERTLCQSLSHSCSSLHFLFSTVRFIGTRNAHVEHTVLMANNWALSVPNGFLVDVLFSFERLESATFCNGTANAVPNGRQQSYYPDRNGVTWLCAGIQMGGFVLYLSHNTGAGALYKSEVLQ